MVFPGLTAYVNEFPGLGSNIHPVAVDTQKFVPCSTPPVNRAPTTIAIEGVVGAGTCDTISTFNNGGDLATNGIPYDDDACMILQTSVRGPVVGPTPSPGPTPAPSPSVPKPPPAASPPTTPSPPPSTLKCVYSGTYTVTPLYGPCNAYYVAWASPSNCSNTVVNLRLQGDLGGENARKAWRLSTASEGSLGKAANIVAAKTCTNRNLAAPSDPSSGLKLGGRAPSDPSWKWQVVPAQGKKCDEVNLISQNRLDTTAFLSVPKLANNKCSGKFAWVAKDGGRARFKVTKA